MQNSRFHTKLYDKRDHFNFNIIRMTYKSKNTPHNMFYSEMSVETLQRRKAIFQDFPKSAEVLTEKIINMKV